MQAGHGGRGPHIEHNGTRFIISPKIKAFVNDCTPISDRNIELKIAAKGKISPYSTIMRHIADDL